MVTFNYPYSVASNKPMYSFGLLNRSNEPVGNRITNLFNSSNVTNNETPKIRTNSGTRFGTSITEPIVEPNVISPNNNRFMMANFPKPRRTLLRDSFNYQNPYKGDEMTGSFQNVGNAVTSRFGGGTVANPTYPNARYLNVKGKKSNNVDNNTGILNFKPKSNQENIETANKGILSQDKKEKSSFGGLLKNAFDKGVEFAQSDYGIDFFMGMDTGYSDTPKTLLDTIKPGYQYAEAKQQQEIENEIKKQRAKTDNYREPVYRALVRDKEGNQYGLFSSKGQLYADVNGVRVPQQELEKVIGPYDIRNVGDQMDGVISLPKLREVNKEIIDDEISLKKYVKFLQEVDKSGVGYERLINNFTAKMKTFLSTKSKQYNLTEEELAQQIANGNLQGLLGSSRKEVVGGGVLTEQDARRVIEYLGGDVSAFNNPARVQDAISVVFRDKYEKYLNNINDYNIGVQNEYGTRGYKSKEQIKFTEPQLELLDAGITVEMGLRNFDNLSQEELLAIDPNNLSIEKYNQYIQALERFVE